MCHCISPPIDRGVQRGSIYTFTRAPPRVPSLPPGVVAPANSRSNESSFHLHGEVHVNPQGVHQL